MVILVNAIPMPYLSNCFITLYCDNDKKKQSHPVQRINTSTKFFDILRTVHRDIFL